MGELLAAVELTWGGVSGIAEVPAFPPYLPAGDQTEPAFSYLGGVVGLPIFVLCVLLAFGPAHGAESPLPAIGGPSSASGQIITCDELDWHNDRLDCIAKGISRSGPAEGGFTSFQIKPGDILVVTPNGTIERIWPRDGR